MRHNLSSNRAFKKVDRGPDEKGKGALWSVDPEHEHLFEEQDARKQAEGKLVGKKGKNPAYLEPPLRRSVKGEPKGTPLPPPLTSAPLVKRDIQQHINIIAPPPTTSIPVKVEQTSHPIPLAPAVQPAVAPGTLLPAFEPPRTNLQPNLPQASVSALAQAPSAIPPIPASVRLPIVVGPVPSSSPESSSNAADAKPIVLHQNMLILNPTIFSHLTPEQLRDLEALGAQKALEILQGYIVRYYKEKLRAESGRGRGRGRGRKVRGGAPGTSRPQPGPEGLFTTAPLPMRMAKPDAQASASASTDASAIPHVAPIESRSEPPPMAFLQPTEQDAGPDSPIIVVDDDDDDEGSDAHVSKRPRLEEEGSGSS